MNRRLKMIALMGALLLIGCQDGEGLLEGPSLFVADCEGLNEDRTFEPFSMNLDFMGIESTDEVVLLRLSDQPIQVHLADSLALSITVDGSAARDGVLTATTASDELAISLALLARCSRLTTALVGVNGVAEFTELGVEEGQRVTGSVSFDVQDARSGEIVGPGFSATFDFEVLTGAPYSPFTPRP